MVTKIEWVKGAEGRAGETWNVITGCSKTSPGCQFCYAERMARRTYRDSWRPWTEKNINTNLRIYPERFDAPFRWREPRMVFVCSMADLFHPAVSDETIGRVWQVMGATPRHTYMILTKRPERMHKWAREWYSGGMLEPSDVRPVYGYPGYSISTDGVVFGKRNDTRAGLVPDFSEAGYQRVTLYRKGSPRGGERELVHRLVLATFVRRPLPAEQACHRNGNPRDNRFSNLYWGTQEDNWRDRISHGNARSYAKLTEEQVEEIRRRAEIGQSAYRISKDYPVSDTQIRNIVGGRQWNMPDSGPEIRPPARTVLDSVWLGVSVEDQERADERIPHLLGTPAALRFVSVEPMLEPVDLSSWLGTCLCGMGFYAAPELHAPSCHRGSCLDWIIAGGESGPGARPLDLLWLRSLRDQCRPAGIPFFAKQLGSFWARSFGRGADYKGAKSDEWPEDLRVREMPEVGR